MEKIKVKICLGTACTVFGAAQFQSLEDVLPEEWKDKVIIEGCTCLESYKNHEFGRAPYVKIDDKLLCSATIPSILAAIEAKLMAAGEEE